MKQKREIFRPSEESDISVIICIYTEKRWNDILDAVESLRQQTLQPREILLSVDYNPALLQRVRHEIPDVVALENKNTRGLSGARNSGIAVAKGSLIAFLDDDATAEPDWLQKLHACLADEQVMGVGGTVEPEWIGKQPKWFPREFYWTVGCSYQRRPDHPVQVRNPFGGCTCYRREVFLHNGGFREDIGRVGTLPLGCEETELCIRASQRWPERFFLYEPRASIHHRIPEARARWGYFRSRCYAEGLSKAAVTRYVGSKDGLASERDYTLRLLPAGVIRGLLDGILHRDLSGMQRAAAILAGLLITFGGFIRGRLSLLGRPPMPLGAPQGQERPSLLANTVPVPHLLLTMNTSREKVESQ
jgi:glucosyl-dolichyl phosphate glucuronosyltransferase